LEKARYFAQADHMNNKVVANADGEGGPLSIAGEYTPKRVQSFGLPVMGKR
jgi:hypothetical protein